MLHPDLIWQMHLQREEERHQRGNEPFDTGVAYISRRLLGRALIAIGTRLTPAPDGVPPHAVTPPRLAAPSLK